VGSVVEQAAPAAILSYENKSVASSADARGWSARGTGHPGAFR